LEEMREFRTSIHLLFIDFKSVYDSINREQMYVTMNELNIPQKLIRLVTMIMSNMQSQIKIQSMISALFIIHKAMYVYMYVRVFNKETHWHVFSLI